MRLVTVQTPGGCELGFQLEAPGPTSDVAVYSLSRAATALGRTITGSAWPDVLAFIEAGEETWKAAAETIAAFASLDRNEQASAALEGALVAPIPRPRKNIVCVGRNYAEHAREQGAEAPEHPVFFTKAPTTVNAPDAAVPYPRATSLFDYEGELAVIIGRRGKDIGPETAWDYVFGYTIANDLTARDLQKRHQQWFRGKSLDGTCPLGPTVVTADEAGRPTDWRLETRVNGELRQSASTAEMIFDIPTLIAVLSDGMTLEPGDIILTGTPAGVGAAIGRPLQVGDVVEVTIDRIGTLRTEIGPPSR